MKIGVCTNWKSEERLRQCKAAGADFVELNFNTFHGATEEEIGALKALLDELELPCLSYNGMLPAACRVTGKEKDLKKAADFMEVVLSKVHVLGARNVVFGSCGARELHEGEDREGAFADLHEFISEYLPPLLARYSFDCSIETLSECNVVHTMDDGLRLTEAAEKPNIRLLCDFYHVWVNGEDLGKFPSYAPYLRHVHVASPTQNRSFPYVGDGDEAYYVEMFRILKAAGYTGGISIEGRSPSEDYEARLAGAVAYLRDCMEKA